MKKKRFSGMIRVGGVMKVFLISLFLMISTACVAKESRTKIVVIDSGVSYSQSVKPYMCKDGVDSLVDNYQYDTNGHGTNIVSIISKSVNPKTHCIVSLKVWYNSISSNDSVNGMIKALKRVARDSKVGFVNISMGGEEPSPTERALIRTILDRGVTITVAAGNNKDDLDYKCNYFPACYRQTIKNKNFHVVKSMLDSSNYGKVVTDTFSGYRVGKPVRSGTSQAAAQKMAQILKSMVYSNRRTHDRLQYSGTSYRVKRNYR